MATYIEDKSVIAEALELNGATDFQHGWNDFKSGYDPRFDSPEYMAGYIAAGRDK